MNSAHSCIYKLLMFPWLMSTLFPLPATWSFCVCRDKTSEWSIVPKGTELFLSARGSCSLERPKTAKGNSVKGRMTSPSSSCRIPRRQQALQVAYQNQTSEKWPRHTPEFLREDTKVQAFLRQLQGLLAALLGSSPRIPQWKALR